MATIDELIVKISADVSELNAAMKQAAATTKTATDKIANESAKAAEKGRSAFQGFGGAIQVAAGNLIASGITKGLQLLGQGLSTVKNDYLEFSSAIAEVNSLLPENAKLTAQAKDQFVLFAGAYGSTAQQQAKAYYDIVSSGFTDTTQALGILNQANRAAAAGVTDVGVAVSGLTSVINVYGDEGIDAAKAADILFKTVQKGVTTFPQLAATLGNVTSIAKAAGLSFEELAGTVGFLTTKGISTAEAVTSLRGLLVGLAGPTDAAKKAAKELGVELGSAALEQNGFATTVKGVIDATGGQIDKIRQLIPDVNAAKAVAAIASGDFKDFEAALLDTANAGGAAAEAFKEIEKSSSFQFDKFVLSLRAIPQLFLNIQDDGISGFLTQLNDGLPDAISFALKALGGLVFGIDAAVKVFEFFGNQIGTNLGLIVGWGQTWMKVLSGDFSEAITTAKVTLGTFVDETKKNFDGLTADSALSTLAGGLLTAADKAKELGADLSKLGESKTPIDGTGGSVDDLGTKLSETSELAKQFVMALAAAKLPEAENSERLSALQQQLEAELITQEEFGQKRRDLLEEQLIAEQELINEYREANKTSAAESAEIQAEFEQRGTEKRLELANKEQKERERLNSERERNFDSTLSNISTLASSNNKQLAGIGKASAIAQGTMKTYEAANVALASAPPPFNFALAAGVVAAGIANVAKIAGTPLAGGIDSIPGMGFKDNFPAVLAPGERVVPRETNKDLKQFLNSGSNGAAESQSIVVNLNIEGNFFESDDANIKLVERINNTIRTTGQRLVIS